MLLLPARLGQADRLDLAAQVLRREADPLFRAVSRLLPAGFGALPLARLEGPGLAALLALLSGPAEETPPARQARERLLASGLFSLAMLADAPAAAALLDRLATAGLSAADPRLDPLRLNAMLPGPQT
jgi:hypothetical protein